MDINFAKTISVLGAIAFIVTTSFGVNAYFAKDKDLTSVKVDVAMLGKAFQYDQFENQISSKQERLFKINDRLLQRITPQERDFLLQNKKELEKDIEKLQKDQRRLQ